MQDMRGKKIFVGLSGGVDSAVSAALLKEAGAQVTGVFIKGWYPPGLPCTWAADRRDAMRVAARLKIPFLTLEAGAEYKKEVMDYLVSEYRAGRTPNPDVMCNRGVKFGAFHRFAKAQGADAIATGHYLSGEKDQRYFLWAVPKRILAEAVFPVGDKDKKEVRALAKHFNLPVADKPDSQGICFLGPISVEDYLKSEFGTVPGTAVNEEGKVVGKHEGALLYTLGERVSLAGASEGPWYVRSKDIQGNVLVVGKGLQHAHPVKGIIFKDANWTGKPEEADSAQYRYRGPRMHGKIENALFIPEMPLSERPAPGQSIVFYRGDELVGGGTIVS